MIITEYFLSGHRGAWRIPQPKISVYQIIFWLRAVLLPQHRQPAVSCLCRPSHEPFRTLDGIEDQAVRLTQGRTRRSTIVANRPSLATSNSSTHGSESPDGALEVAQACREITADHQPSLPELMFSLTSLISSTLVSPRQRGDGIENEEIQNKRPYYSLFRRTSLRLSQKPRS